MTENQSELRRAFFRDRTNDYVEFLLREKLIPGFESMDVVRREVRIGRSRFDFLLNGGGNDFVLEVKNCTLFGSIVSMFPDAATERGRLHLIELSELKKKGMMGGILFVVWWPEARYFIPEYHTDFDFSKTLIEIRDKLLIKAIALGLKNDFSLGSKVRELEIPWDLIEREARHQGAYIIILHLKEDRKLKVGDLGKFSFRKGYYLYVGSAKKGLISRIKRHQRKRKKFFWHVDYLRKVTSFYKALPIRTGADIECGIARGLEKIAAWNVPGFGSSDCSCRSHLFGMGKNPLLFPPFIHLLRYYRITLLEKQLRIQSRKMLPKDGLLNHIKCYPNPIKDRVTCLGWT